MHLSPTLAFAASTFIVAIPVCVIAAALSSPIELFPILEKKSTTITYCNTYDGTCGGVCVTTTVDGAKCLDVPGTNCLKADANVIFCNDTTCAVQDLTGACNNYNNCAILTSDGYCWTPGTNSIQT